MPWTDGLSKPADIISRWLHDYVYDHPARALRVTLDSPFSPDGVFTEDEFADPLTRLGLLVGGVGPDDHFHALNLTDDGRLMVDAVITLSTTELEIEVDTVDGDNVGMFGYINGDFNDPHPVSVTPTGEVNVSISPNKSMVTVYDEDDIATGNEIVVAAYTVPAGRYFSLVKVEASGRADAVFRLRKNADMIGAQRNNWCDRNIKFDYFYGLNCNPGDIIALTVYHTELTSIPFNATIYGELL